MGCTKLHAAYTYTHTQKKIQDKLNLKSEHELTVGFPFIQDKVHTVIMTVTMLVVTYIVTYKSFSKPKQ